MFCYSSKSNQTRQTVPTNNRFRKHILEMCCDESCRVYKLVSYYAIWNRKLQMCIIVRKRFLYFVCSHPRIIMNTTKPHSTVKIGKTFTIRTSLFSTQISLFPLVSDLSRTISIKNSISVRKLYGLCFI